MSTYQQTRCKSVSDDESFQTSPLGSPNFGFIPANLQEGIAMWNEWSHLVHLIALSRKLEAERPTDRRQAGSRLCSFSAKVPSAPNPHSQPVGVNTIQSFWIREGFGEAQGSCRPRPFPGPAGNFGTLMSYGIDIADRCMIRD
jgi:hypothetical protein